MNVALKIRDKGVHNLVGISKLFAPKERSHVTGSVLAGNPNPISGG